MTLGTGIFLGLLCTAAVWLYLSTRDRWKWRRIALTSLATIVVIFAALYAWIEISSYVANRPTHQTEFLGLKVGMTKGDVVFIKGQARLNKEDDDRWEYESGDVTELVRFRDGRVRYIVAFSKSRVSYNIPTLQGISGYSTPEDVEKKFDKPDFISISDDQTTRLWSFNSFGLIFGFQKGHVDAVGIFDPSGGPVRFPKEFNQ
jgi:hypothetical protein